MKTILDQKSLVFWKQNQNGTNIYVNGGKDIHLFLKDNYLNVFKTIRDELSDKSKSYTSFVKLWHKVCNDECNIVRKSVRELIIHDYEDAQADIEKVVMKFRGNLGEIFAEAFFKANLVSDICDGSTYMTVDPDNERFVDGNAISNATGLNIGIQVKNYNVSLVPKEIFDKALAEDSMRIRIDKSVPQDKLIDYLSSPHQMIFSFTDAQNLFIESNADAIIFFGPKDIDSKKLQGDLKKKIKPNWMFFDKICKEIENLK